MFYHFFQTKSFPIGCAVLWLALSSQLCHANQDDNISNKVFTVDTEILETDLSYEGWNLSADGCTLTILGDHTFTELATANGAIVFSGTNLSLSTLSLTEESSMSLAGGATLTVTQEISITGSSILTAEGAHVSEQVGGNWIGTGGTIVAGSVNIEAGSRISADAQGYAGGSGVDGIGKGPGGGNPRESSNDGSGGGGYGGIGGT
ncbi:MAG: hypothetical protein JXR40_02895, partial [Pontiellaceae bacterium]|nr:hypothetical protein [Pontiellaceae bacterium]